MNSFEKKIKIGIDEITQGDLSAFTPGLCLQVVKNGKLKADLKLGKTYPYYDLASLTKIIFTVPAFMALADDKRIFLKDKISAILNWWPHSKTEIREVLSHSGGLPWWAPFYKKLDLSSSVEERRHKVQKILEKTKLISSEKSVYSDLDFILLGFVLEELHSAPLIEIWQSLSWLEKVPSLHFNILNKPKYKKNLYAPTEQCPWRKKTLQGEVHDDNTWAFGGVSTHAGLFGSVEDVTQYGLLLRKSFNDKKSNGQALLSKVINSKNILASPKTIEKFCQRAISKERGDWAMGFMLPTRGSASCGKYFHSSSFGHTGFTGTSIWYDPKQDLLVTLLSNRVHPTRENKKFIQLRPLIHDLIVQEL